MTQTVARTNKSTIVRLFSAPWPVRATFGALEWVAPAIGARWAAKIWLTLPRPKPGRAAQRPPGGASFVIRVNDLPSRARSSNVAGTDVIGEVWGDGPSVYLVHGWAGNRGQFHEFVAPLVARGFRVVAFDMPSHGDSAPGPSGRRSSTFPEFTETLQQVVARYGRPHAIVAHSAGAIATAGALCDGLPADRVVLIAPMASGTSHVRDFATVLGFGNRTLARMVGRIERRVGAPMSHFDVPELARAVAMPPALVIHDREDRSSPVTDGAAVAAAWRGARLKVTSGLGHNRILRSPEVVADAVDFIAA